MKKAFICSLVPLGALALTLALSGWKGAEGGFWGRVGMDGDMKGEGRLAARGEGSRRGEGRGEGPPEGASKLEGPMLDGQTTRGALDRATLCGIGRLFRCDANEAEARGLFETGLKPRFPEGLACRGIDEGYAISYADKRNREVYHGGIDMPAPWGEPIIASAAGTVIAKYGADNSPRGIEIVIRHRPEDTGIPLWLYTQYTHFSEMPKQKIGQRVRMGEVLGPTGNSGLSGKGTGQSQRRRPAIHYAVFYSESEKFVAVPGRIVPVEGWWMDPVALFRKKLPLDTSSMKALPEGEKSVPIAVMLEDGRAVPPDAKIVWPYRCRRK